jgi:hypothetical protein
MLGQRVQAFQALRAHTTRLNQTNTM